MKVCHCGAGSLGPEQTSLFCPIYSDLQLVVMRSVYCLFIWMFTLYYKTIKLKSNETKHHSKKIQGILQTKLNSSGALPAIHLYVLSIFKINFVICCTFSRDPPSLKVDVTFVRGLSCLENVIVKCFLKY